MYSVFILFLNSPLLFNVWPYNWTWCYTDLVRHPGDQSVKFLALIIRGFCTWIRNWKRLLEIWLVNLTHKILYVLFFVHYNYYCLIPKYHIDYIRIFIVWNRIKNKLFSALNHVLDFIARGRDVLLYHKGFDSDPISTPLSCYAMFKTIIQKDLYFSLINIAHTQDTWFRCYLILWPCLPCKALSVLVLKILAFCTLYIICFQGNEGYLQMLMWITLVKIVSKILWWCLYYLVLQK